MTDPAVEVGQRDGVSVVTIPDGSMLDGVSIQKVAQQLFDVVEKGKGDRLVIDFSRIRFMSSQALGVLLTLRRKAEKNGTRVVLAGITEKLKRVFEITNLHTMFTFCDDVDAGVTQLGGPPPAAGA